MSRHGKTIRGVSLVELVIVIVLVGIVAAVTGPMLATGFDAWFRGQDVEESQRQAVMALERMTRELRVGADIVVNPGEITFERSSESSAFTFVGGRLDYTVGGNTRTLARRVASAEFTDESTEDTRYITITLEIQGSGAPYRTTIHPRRRQ